MALVAGQVLKVTDLYRGGGFWVNNAGQVVAGTTNTPGQYPTTVVAAPSFVSVSGTGNSTFTLLRDGVYTIGGASRCGTAGLVQFALYAGGGTYAAASTLVQGSGNPAASASITGFFASSTIIRTNLWFPTGGTSDINFGGANGLYIAYHGVATP